MACQDNYIAFNRDESSRSGLYVSDLPGIEELMLSLLSKDSEADAAVYERIYGNAWNQMVSDIEQFLQSKFYVNHKLISRVTSEFKDELNTHAGLAGVQLEFPLPRYARVHIISVSVDSEQEYLSPELTVYVYKNDENGDLLHSVSEDVATGKNTIEVDHEFDENKLFIAYDASLFELKKTENKFYNTGYPQWNKFECMFPCFNGNGYVRQINGGGLNVLYNVICSAEKFVCENINLFKKVFWWNIGAGFAVERRIGNRLNQFTTMTDERKTELFNFYNNNYQQALDNSLKEQNIHEDPYCFTCKGVLSTTNILP